MMTPDQYGQIYQEGFVRTVRLLRCRGASPSHAEDLAQSAWMQGWRKLDQLRDQAMLQGWINTIALNYYRRSGPREARYQELSGFEVSGGLGFDPTPLDIAKVLKTCQHRDRILFEQQLGGLSTQEIADRQGISTTATRIRLLRARRAVRASMEGRAAALRESFQALASSVAA